MGEVTQRIVGAWDFSGCGGFAGVDVSAAAGQLSGAKAGYRATGDWVAAGAVTVRAQSGQRKAEHGRGQAAGHYGDAGAEWVDYGGEHQPLLGGDYRQLDGISAGRERAGISF